MCFLYIYIFVCVCNIILFILLATPDLGWVGVGFVWGLLGGTIAQWRVSVGRVVWLSLLLAVRRSHAQNLAGLVVADGDPVRLRGAPLDLVHLALGGRVREYRVLDGARHLLDVPDQRLVVVAGRADVAGAADGGRGQNGIGERWPMKYCFF